MENRILLEGINAMLEEIRDNVKSNPELEVIKSKLITIEKVCNDLTEKKLITEDVMAGYISYMLKQMIEMNNKQDEKMEKLKGYILGHHKFLKEQVEVQLNISNKIFSLLENLKSKKSFLLIDWFKSLYFK